MTSTGPTAHALPRCRERTNGQMAASVVRTCQPQKQSGAGAGTVCRPRCVHVAVFCQPGPQRWSVAVWKHRVSHPSGVTLLL